jgi:AmiR/NasT family two-component response regulator
MEQRDVVAGLRQMQVGLCHPLGAECRLISQQLERLGMTYQQVWPPVHSELLTVDLVVLALVPEAFIKIDKSLLKLLKNKIVVSVLQFESPTVLDLACQLNSSSLLFSPVKPFGVLSAIVLAQNQQKVREDLIKRINKLEGRIESSRIIEQAKRFLIETSGVSDAEAFKIIRNRSMDKRCSVEEVAHSIITAKDALESALGKTSPVSSSLNSESKPKVSGSVVRIK